MHRTDAAVVDETEDSIQVENLNGDLVWLPKAEIEIGDDDVITMSQELATEKGLM
jgi:hypothetical protein